MSRPAPGAYRGVAFGDYTAWSGASSSQLGRLARSPAHLRAYLDGRDQDRTYYAMGRAVHCAVLEPTRWPHDYVRGIEGDGRTNAVKEAREAQRKEHPRAEVLTPRDFDLAEAMRDAVMAHPVAAALLVAGESELSLAWEQDGVGCKGRLDLHAGSVIADLKTTQDASPESFAASSWRYGYHRQAALYLSGARAVGLDAQRYVVIAVEKDAPHAVALYEYDHGALDAGEQQVRRLLALYQRCVEEDRWPGYGDEVRPLTLPGWAWSKIEEVTT